MEEACPAGSPEQTWRKLRSGRNFIGAAGKGEYTSPRPSAPCKPPERTAQLRHGGAPTARGEYLPSEPRAVRAEAARPVQSADRHRTAFRNPTGTPVCPEIDIGNDTIAGGRQHHANAVNGVLSLVPTAAARGWTCPQPTQTPDPCGVDQSVLASGASPPQTPTARNPHAGMVTDGSRKSPD